MKENKKTYILIIVLLVILVLGLIGYIVYDKLNTKDESETKEEVKKPEEEKEPEKEVEEHVTENAEVILEEGVVSGFKYHKVKTPMKFTTITNESVVAAAREYLNERLTANFGFYNDIIRHKGNLNNLDNLHKVDGLYWYLKEDNKTLYDYTADKVLVIARELFGSDFNLELKDIVIEGRTYYKFNTKTNKFENGLAIDDIVYDLAASEIMSFKKVGNQYKVTVKQIFVGGSYGENEYFDFDHKTLFTREAETDDKIISQEEFEKYIDKITAVEYTFEIENNILVLKSINY